MDKRLKTLLELGHIHCPDSISLSLWADWIQHIQEAMCGNNPLSLVVKNPNRKWELVSAYQKTVRRGDLPLARGLVSAMVSMGDERAYMWKRIATTSAEDIGGGNPLVMKFVLSAYSCFPPTSLSPDSMHGLWGVLTDLMCGSAKGREYCQYSILKDCLTSPDMTYKCFDASTYGSKVKAVLYTSLKEVAQTPGDSWLVTSNWRVEGMAVGPLWSSMLGTTTTPTAELLPAHQTMYGLPSYAYDMHTRVGKGAIMRLCGKLPLRQLFASSAPTSKPTAVGWAMFFEEGGKIQGRYASPELDALEQVAVAERMGLPLPVWAELRSLVAAMLASGEVDEIRTSVISQAGY
jgi:hypothetical protein